MSFADRSFDRVKAIGSIHRMPDPAKALKEARRVLKRRGDYVSMLYNKDSLRVSSY